jgi:hypothetical protein
MKRFIFFAYDSYYPSGGCDDIKADFDTLEEAMAYKPKYQPTHLEILDTQTYKKYYRRWVKEEWQESKLELPISE